MPELPNYNFYENEAIAKAAKEQWDGMISTVPSYQLLMTALDAMATVSAVDDFIAFDPAAESRIKHAYTQCENTVREIKAQHLNDLSDAPPAGPTDIASTLLQVNLPQVEDVACEALSQFSGLWSSARLVKPLSTNPKWTAQGGATVDVERSKVQSAMSVLEAMFGRKDFACAATSTAGQQTESDGGCCVTFTSQLTPDGVCKSKATKGARTVDWHDAEVMVALLAAMRQKQDRVRDGEHNQVPSTRGSQATPLATSGQPVKGESTEDPGDGIDPHIVAAAMYL